MSIPKTCNQSRMIDLRFQCHVYSTNLNRKYILRFIECFIEVLMWKNQKVKTYFSKIGQCN